LDINSSGKIDVREILITFSFFSKDVIQLKMEFIFDLYRSGSHIKRKNLHRILSIFQILCEALERNRRYRKVFDETLSFVEERPHINRDDWNNIFHVNDAALIFGIPNLMPIQEKEVEMTDDSPVRVTYPIKGSIVYSELRDHLNFTKVDLLSLRELFYRTDVHKSGDIDFIFFKKLIRRCNLIPGVSDAILENLFSHFIIKGKGVANINELITALCILGSGDPHEKYSFIYDIWDPNLSGLDHHQIESISHQFEVVASFRDIALSPNIISFIDMISKKTEIENGTLLSKSDWLYVATFHPSLLDFLAGEDNNIKV